MNGQFIHSHYKLLLLLLLLLSLFLTDVQYYYYSKTLNVHYQLEVSELRITSL